MLVGALVWLVLPVIAVAISAAMYLVVKRKLRHDWILFSFCEVRDAFALLALEEKLSEDSSLFKFFYTTNAAIIHSHEDHGSCFYRLFKEIVKVREDIPRYGSNRIEAELEYADAEIKKVVTVYNRAFFVALLNATPYAIAERLFETRANGKETIGFQRLAKSLIVRREQRENAKFGLSLSRFCAA